MRTKKFKVLFIAAALLVSASAFAQNGRVSIGAELALPMGDFGESFSIGFGGSARYEHPVGDNMGLTLTAGYLTFSAKEELEGFKFTSIPIQAGFKYYFQEQQSGFYGMAELGVHMSTATIEIPEVSFGGVVLFPATEIESSSTDLSFAPAVGYMLDNIDIGLRYQIISTEGSSTSYLGVRLAYVFGEK